MDNYTALLRRLTDLERRMAKAQITDRARPVVVRYETAAGQSIPNNTATIVDYGSPTFDPDGHVTTGAAWRFTAQIPGYYRVSAAVLYTSSTTWALGEVGDLRLYKNGLEISKLDRNDEMASSAAAQFKFLGGSDLIYLVATDYIDIRTIQLSGAALALFNNATFNYVAIHKVT